MNLSQIILKTNQNSNFYLKFYGFFCALIRSEAGVAASRNSCVAASRNSCAVKGNPARSLFPFALDCFRAPSEKLSSVRKRERLMTYLSFFNQEKRGNYIKQSALFYTESLRISTCEICQAKNSIQTKAFRSHR